MIEIDLLETLILSVYKLIWEKVCSKKFSLSLSTSLQPQKQLGFLQWNKFLLDKFFFSFSFPTKPWGLSNTKLLQLSSYNSQKISKLLVTAYFS